MTLRWKLYRMLSFKKTKKLNVTRLIALVFAAIILLGALLLMLPVSSRNGISCGFIPALFTATSATCVTGLVLYDTWSQWSGLGQIVILSLIQLGGLGFMSVASLAIFAFRKKVGLKQRMVMAQALSMDDMEGVVRLQKWVLTGSLLIEFAGAMILTLRFLPEYGLLTGLKWGFFHAITAFCNAGFDIFGVLSPGSSLILFNGDPVVLLTLSAMVILGGLGFFVWEEVIRVRSLRKCSVYTRLVLIMTGILLVFGTVMICLCEWKNPGTLRDMPVWQKILNAFFQAVTSRTAGFAAIDQGMLSDAGKAVTMILMFVGGSSGSTAGGVKTVTILVLFLFIWARARGRSTVGVFRRTVPGEKVMDAATIVLIVLTLAIFGSIVISMTSPVSFVDSLFETVSALSTTGVTAGATGKLSLISQLLIIVYMYFGRVGVLTISLGFLMGKQVEERFHYAQTNLLIG